MKIINNILNNFTLNTEGIYTNKPINNEEQTNEILIRTGETKNTYINYLEEIRTRYSVRVMDFEVKKFINKLPRNAVILDIGGGWGWHWRNIHLLRKDITVIIVDFIYENFFHAKNILRDLINKHIFLVHGDATKLDFCDKLFDAVWTVQTFQHIPNYEKVINEAYRVTVDGGIFKNYSLNYLKIISAIFKLFDKKYINNEYIKNGFFLARASDEQKSIIERIYQNECVVEYSEILFKPELKLTFMGKETSLIGLLDSKLTGQNKFLSLFARQASFFAVKNTSSRVEGSNST